MGACRRRRRSVCQQCRCVRFGYLYAGVERPDEAHGHADEDVQREVAGGGGWEVHGGDRVGGHACVCVCACVGVELIWWGDSVRSIYLNIHVCQNPSIHMYVLTAGGGDEAGDGEARDGREEGLPEVGELEEVGGRLGAMGCVCVFFRGVCVVVGVWYCCLVWLRIYKRMCMRAYTHACRPRTSMEKSTPPMGAAKVEETPTAQAASRTCRRREGKRKTSRNQGSFISSHEAMAALDGCVEGWGGVGCGVIRVNGTSIVGRFTTHTHTHTHVARARTCGCWAPPARWTAPRPPPAPGPGPWPGACASSGAPPPPPPPPRSVCT